MAVQNDLTTTAEKKASRLELSCLTNDDWRRVFQLQFPPSSHSSIHIPLPSHSLLFFFSVPRVPSCFLSPSPPFPTAAALYSFSVMFVFIPFELSYFINCLESKLTRCLLLFSLFKSSNFVLPRSITGFIQLSTFILFL